MFYRGLIICTLIVNLLACGQQVEEYAERPTLKKVDQLFAPKFVRGEWRYRGAKAIDKGIAAYIQIPERIGLSDKQHKNYVLVTICPKAQDKEFWQGVYPYKLFIRTYNYVDRNYIETPCPSPIGG
ncbi:hypothetical protein C2869_14720 [Saccharobesus litoralis]|uniref:Uncharacterized protein n=1 Tax=Saccharobesus litoralis TaxID=2172099 RepID=A0A2S0VTT0_9ALTE|nr:hypothetical protein [Saccharobesus litoralis]AWB67615.1 hypothetical protein C2869_14720 [Saccharobesus litoralis]